MIISLNHRASNLLKTLYVTLKASIDSSYIDEFCYTIYSLFKNAALSMAVERPLCNRVVIVGKNFEVRFFTSSTSNSVISIIIETDNNMLKNVKSFLNNTLLQLNKAVPKRGSIDKNIKLGIHTTLKTNQINIEELIQKLFNLSIVLDRTENRMIEGFPIMVIKGSIIGYDLRKYEVAISVLTSDGVELSITIETNICLDKMFNAINYLNDLLDILTESIMFD